MSSRPGFSLLEAMVATAILSVGVLGSVAALSAGWRTATEAMRLDSAVALAENLLAEAVAAAEGTDTRRGSESGYEWVIESVMLEPGLLRIDVRVIAPGGGAPIVLSELVSLGGR